MAVWSAYVTTQFSPSHGCTVNRRGLSTQLWGAPVFKERRRGDCKSKLSGICLWGSTISNYQSVVLKLSVLCFPQENTFHGAGKEVRLLKMQIKSWLWNTELPLTPWATLCKALQEYGVPGSLNKLVVTKVWAVSILGTKSNMLSVGVALPQGCILHTIYQAC